MRIIASLVVSTLLLLGCAKKNESTAFSPTQAAAPQETRTSPARRLAYEHSVTVDTAEEKLPDLFATIQSKCREFSADACEVIEARVSTGRTPHASLKLRLKPAGVQQILGVLNQGGTVVEQSTTAEDLAAPIADVQRRLALKTDYRTKLEELRKQASNDVDALIKVNRELSEVQSEIEALTGTNANLLRRVETEVINISLYSARNRTFLRPISDAFSDFGTNLSQGIAAAVTAIPFLIPWALLFAVVFWIVRKLWSRRRRAAAGA